MGTIAKRVGIDLVLVELAYLYQSEKPQRFCLCNCIGERHLTHNIL
jgi:hypothetical protein